MRSLLPILLMLLSTWVTADPDTRTGQSFEGLLAEGELVFSPPQGYEELPPGRTPMLDYERALRSPDGALEIRLAIRPLKRLLIEYDDPHGATPNPNHVFPLVFESLATRLSGGRHAPSNAYPPDRAREKFQEALERRRLTGLVRPVHHRHIWLPRTRAGKADPRILEAAVADQVVHDEMSNI